MVLEASSKNSTLTWVTPPLEPVLPKTLITLAKVTGVLASYKKKMTNVNICCSSRKVSLQKKTYHFDVLLNVICIVRKEKKKEEEKRNRRNLVL